MATTDKKAIPEFKNFIVSGEETSAGIRWKKYVMRFKNMLEAYQITDDNQKKALLLHNAGEEVFDIFISLPEEKKEENFEGTVKNLTKYFMPKKSTEYEIHKFRRCSQMPDESLDAYHTRLRHLSLNCEFENSEKEIKSQIIQACTSKKLRLKALQDSPNLEQLLVIGRSMEMAEQQAKAMVTEEINKIKTKKPRDKSQLCWFCGKEYPHKGACPAKGKSCNNCGKPNHFEKVCRQKNQNNVNTIDGTSENSSDEKDFI